MKIAFLDGETLGGDLDFTPFESLGEVAIWPLTTADQMVKHIGGAQVLVVNKVKITSALLTENPEVQFVALTATGYNNVDLDACQKRGVGVANVKGYSTPSVVQHTLALVLSLMENLSFFQGIVNSGQWSRSGRFTHLDHTFAEVSGKVWGILGMGDIGKEVAQVAQALGAQVVYFSTTGSARNPDYPRLEWDDFLGAVDILTIHSPLTDLTRGMIGAQELKKMKKSAVLVNVGRGGIVVEKDLAQALDQGDIAGAAIDVFEKEPFPEDHPFLTIQNKEKLVMTPHIAWASVESRTRCLREVWENIKAFQEGRLRNRLDC